MAKASTPGSSGRPERQQVVAMPPRVYRTHGVVGARRVVTGVVLLRRASYGKSITARHLFGSSLSFRLVDSSEFQ